MAVIGKKVYLKIYILKFYLELFHLKFSLERSGLFCEDPISVSISILKVQWHLALEFYALVYTTIKLPFLVVLFTLNDTPLHSSRNFCER